MADLPNAASTNKNIHAGPLFGKWGSGGWFLHHNCGFTCETSLCDTIKMHTTASSHYPSRRSDTTLTHGHQYHINPFVTPWGSPQSTPLTQTLSHPTASCGRPFSHRQHPPITSPPTSHASASPRKLKQSQMGSPHEFVVKQPLLLSFSFGLSPSVHLIHIDVKKKQKNLHDTQELTQF